MPNYFERQAARRQWQQQWPNHCTRCEGAGVLEYDDDPSPTGVSLAPGTMRFTDPCPQCVEYDLCPRCGGDLDELTGDEALTCPHCGWNSENPERCPPDPREGCFGEDDPVYTTLRNAGMSQAMLTWFCGDYELVLSFPTRDETVVMQIANQVDVKKCASQREFDLAVVQALRERRDVLTQALRSLELVHEPTSFAEAEAMGYELLGEQRDDQGTEVRRDYESPEGQFLILIEPTS